MWVGSCEISTRLMSLTSFSGSHSSSNLRSKGSVIGWCYGSATQRRLVAANTVCCLLAASGSNFVNGKYTLMILIVVVE